MSQLDFNHKGGIYVTSKIGQATQWQLLRREGYPIISSWIDYGPTGPNDDLTDLWIACIEECKRCRALVVLPDAEANLKGGLIEIGAAIASGAYIFIVGDCPEMGTAWQYPNVERTSNLHEAMEKANAVCQSELTSTPSSKPMHEGGGILSLPWLMQQTKR